MNLHESINRIFNKVFKFKFKIEVDSIDGWHRIDSLNITEPVEMIEIQSETGRKLKCAKDHILYDENGKEIFAKDVLGKNVITESGLERIVDMTILNKK